MDETSFKKYLRKGGRTPAVAERVIKIVQRFESFLAEKGGKKTLDQASLEDLKNYVNWIECGEEQASAKTDLWAIRYYYDFRENEEIAHYASALRQERITRKPFNLREFRGIDPVAAQALENVGIRNVKQMLDAGKSPADRHRLVEKTGLPLETIIEFVKLSDLARIPGVKAIRARLYYDAGVDTIEKMAAYDPEELRILTTCFVEESGFEGNPPLPAEVKFSIESARKLSKIVEYD